jgi:membrane protein implicated in regulation of membrane protease activity
MLTLTYVALAGAGCLYVLAALFFGHFFDGGGEGGAHASGHASVAEGYGVDHSGHGAAAAGDGAAAAFHFPFFSPLALATLAASFGGLGLVTRHGLGLSDDASLAAALPGALALTYVVTYLSWRVALGSRGTSTLRDADFADAPAEVLTPIPAGGLGEVTAMVRGERFTSPAREIEGRAVPRGARIRVVRRSGSTFEVRITEGG